MLPSKTTTCATRTLWVELAGRICNVQPFSSNLGIAKHVPIVDMTQAHEYPHKGKVCVLVLRIALHFPSIDQDQIPHFIIKAGGVTVDNVSKTIVKIT